MSVMTATVGATALTRAALGPGPLYGQRAFSIALTETWPWIIGLGVASALAALIFKRVLGWSEALFDAYPVRQPLRAAIGGLLVGTMAIALPSVAGNGFQPLTHLLDSPMTLGAVAMLLAAKVIATSGSVASGIPGGIFTPMLLVGALVGHGWALVVAGATGATPDLGRYALVGMAATTAASIHAPLTAAVMIFEMSGDYPIVLPLLLPTVVGTAASKALGGKSVYEMELSKRGLGWDLTLEGRHVRKP